MPLPIRAGSPWNRDDAALEACTHLSRTTALAKWNRSAVPFNLIYWPGKKEPVILPELLTAGIVLDHLTKAERG